MNTITSVVIAGQSLTMPEELYSFVLQFHSGFRYIILIILLVAIVYAYRAWRNNLKYEGAAKRLGMFTIIAVDIQLLLGLFLEFFFVGSQASFTLNKLVNALSNPEFRYFAIDHTISMLIAIILIHIGYAKAKRAVTSQSAGKKQFIWMLVGLIIILATIPWPFMPLGRDLF